MLRELLNRACTAVFIVALVLFIITASIGLPIYIRPFYYVQIPLWSLEEQTGHDAEKIRAAYDEVLDYLTLPDREFGTGVFAHSEEGKSHFEDCRVLFGLNAAVLLLSELCLAFLVLLTQRKCIVLSCPWGLCPSAVAGGLTLGVFALLSGLVCLDFDYAFELFHAVMFPGKDNWLFDPRQDEIIRALPEEFFASCAALIALSALSISLVLLVRGIKKRKAHLMQEK